MAVCFQSLLSMKCSHIIKSIPIDHGSNKYSSSSSSAPYKYSSSSAPITKRRMQPFGRCPISISGAVISCRPNGQTTPVRWGLSLPVKRHPMVISFKPLGQTTLSSGWLNESPSLRTRRLFGSGVTSMGWLKSSPWRLSTSRASGQTTPSRGLCQIRAELWLVKHYGRCRNNPKLFSSCAIS